MTALRNEALEQEIADLRIRLTVAEDMGQRAAGDDIRRRIKDLLAHRNQAHLPEPRPPD